MFIAQVVGAIAVAALVTGLVLALAQARTLAKWVALGGLVVAVCAGGVAIAAEVRYRNCLDWNRANVRYRVHPIAHVEVVRPDSPLPRRCRRG